jgi:hypothetical protein
MRGAIIDLDKPQWAGSNCQKMSTAERALVFVGNGLIHYHLAYPNGGADPNVGYPQDKQTGGCDCIGFAAWCAGFDRYQPKKFPLYDGYINTDSMIEEAVQSKPGGHWFETLPNPEPGCFIVAASFWKKLPLPRRVIGHIGVVTDCSEWATKGLKGIHVVHCSPSNVHRPGNVNGSAVWKTDGTVWAGYPRVYFVKFNREYAMGLKKQ